MTREPSAAHRAAAMSVMILNTQVKLSEDTVTSTLWVHLPHDPKDVDALVADMESMSNRMRLFAHDEGAEWLAGYADEIDAALARFDTDKEASDATD